MAREHGRSWWVARGCLLLVVLGLAPGLPLGPTGRVELTAASSVDPCSLLTPRQRQQLGVDTGVAQGTACTWTTVAPAAFRGEYLAQLTHGAVTGGNPAPSIDGRPTVEYTPPGLDPRAYCVYLVDLGGGVTLWARYGAPNQAGITHTVACKNAQAGAADMITTYSAVTH